MSDRQQRAEARRATWRAAVVEAGEPKPGLYRHMTPEARLQAFLQLNRRVWRALGEPPRERTPRSEWPGEIFEIREHG